MSAQSEPGTVFLWGKPVEDVIVPHGRHPFAFPFRRPNNDCASVSYESILVPEANEKDTVESAHLDTTLPVVLCLKNNRLERVEQLRQDERLENHLRNTRLRCPHCYMFVVVTKTSHINKRNR